MEVYIEVVILDNFLVDYLLLTSLGVLLPPTGNRFRRMAAAAAGTVYAVLTPLMGFSVLRSAPIKLAAGCLLVVLAFGKSAPGLYLKRCLTFFALGCVLGGMIFAISFLLGTQAAAGGGYLVTGLPLWTLLPLSWGFLKGCEILARSVKGALVRRGDPLTVQFVLSGEEFRFSALIDSGNLMTIPGTGIPVIVLWDDGSLLSFCEQWEVPTVLLPASSVGGLTTITVFRPEAVYLQSGKAKAVTAGIGLYRGLYAQPQALVPASLL